MWSEATMTNGFITPRPKKHVDLPGKKKQKDAEKPHSTATTAFPQEGHKQKTPYSQLDAAQSTNNATTNYPSGSATAAHCYPPGPLVQPPLGRWYSASGIAPRKEHHLARSEIGRNLFGAVRNTNQPPTIIS